MGEIAMRRRGRPEKPRPICIGCGSPLSRRAKVDRCPACRPIKERRTEPDEDDKRDGIQFDRQGRMRYHPDYHTRQGMRYTDEELIYLCKYYAIDGFRGIAFALGRTEASVMGMVTILRQNGDFDYYRSLDEDEWIRHIESDRKSAAH